MSRKRAKGKGKPRPKHTIWCREALSVARLVPPDRTEAQACWSCGKEVHKTMFGYLPKIYEIYDSYGRLVLCKDCLLWHISQLEQDNTTPAVQQQVKPHKQLMTYEQWLLESTVEEMQDVLNKMKARLK